MNERQIDALRRTWHGDRASVESFRRLRQRGDGTFASTILTVERCGCLNHGMGVWHASAVLFDAKGTRLDREQDAVRLARSMLDGVGDPEWELVLWSSDVERRAAHVRIGLTPAEALAVDPRCPVAPDDHEEDGVWVPRATAAAR